MRKVIHVQSRSERGFRRAGLRFGPQPVALDLGALADWQAEAIVAELALPHGGLMQPRQLDEAAADSAGGDAGQAEASHGKKPAKGKKAEG